MVAGENRFTPELNEKEVIKLLEDFDFIKNVPDILEESS